MKKKILEDLKTVSKDIEKGVITVEVFKTTDPKWGDYSTNLPLQLAGSLGKSPVEIAKDLEAKMAKIALGYTVSVAPNGFINFTLEKEFLTDLVGQIVESKGDFGKSDLGVGKKVQIEFISANPTGPLTLGNGRGGFSGDVLANILSFCGYTVSREYYVNNVGNQIQVLGYSIAKELGLVSEELADFYAGSYIKEIAKELKPAIDKLIPSGDERYYFEVGQLAAEALLEDIKRVITAKLAIKFDDFFLESSLYEQKLDQKYLALLKEKGLAYEKDGAIWFKTSDYGDEKDRVLVRSDGQPTYLLSDVAHKNLFANDFDQLIVFLGADHHGYQDRMRAAVEAFGHKGKLQIIIFQLVRLIQDGHEVKMSKRAGTYVALEDLVDEVGVDVTRFFFLMNSYSTHMDFDLGLAKQRSNDNPVYYIQYAHARCASILAKATTVRSSAELSLLKEKAELDLIREMALFPQLLEEIAVNHQVHQLPHYLIGLAEKLHRFYQECVVIGDDESLTAARIELVKAAKIVLQNALTLLGVSAPEKM